MNVRPSDQAAGRSTQEAKLSRATARLTAAGRTREQAATEIGSGDPGIHVSEAPPPDGQAKCDFARSAPVGAVNAKGNPQGNSSGNCGGNAMRQIDVSGEQSPQSKAVSGFRSRLR